MKNQITGFLARSVTFSAIIAGILAGFTNGLIGSGGGLVIYYALAVMKRNSSRSTSERLAASLAVCLPMSLVSAAVYHTNIIPGETLFIFLVFGTVGSLIGANISGRIKDRFLRMLFALILLIGGIKMLF